MMVRWRIFTLELVSLFFVLAMIGIMALALSFADYFVQRVDGVHRRFEVVAEIDGLASKYAAQVSEVLLLGREQIADLQTARLNMERAFARLTQVTRSEIETLRGIEEVRAELPEIENTRRMIELYHSIDSATARLVVLQRDGQQAEAIRVFQNEVEFRLKTELAALIDNALTDEREEVADELADVQAIRINIIIGAVVVALIGLLIMVLLGFLLRRSIVGPVRKLTDGAEAIAAGDLGHRITLEGKDEFARLSQSFNAMAEAFENQRTGLMQAREKLSSEIDARTSQLREANERLRNIDDRRAQFLADVSHELRTPLTILRGEADVALRSGDDPRSSLQRIQGQAAELGQLLDDLISFARTDAEPQTFVLAETRLDDIVAAAVQEGETLAEPREVALTTGKPSDAQIDADFRRLKQAFIIGLDNAIRHSPPGGRVDIATERSERTVTITMRDQGPGLAEEDKQHLFERFYRGRTNENGFSEGLGIGLSIARDIVERHGGTIGLDNREDGPGAILTITLPLFGNDAP